jgi:hypothetical protein
MQITINTADLLGDETTIRDEVIERVADSLAVHLKKEAAAKLSAVFESSITSVVRETVAGIVAAHIDAEIVKVDSYGRIGQPTTIRGEIAERLEKMCEFKLTTYSSEQNAFTTVVKKTVEEEVVKFKKDYISLVNAKLLKECLDEATKKLKAACGIA